MTIRNTLALFAAVFICSCSGKSGSENNASDDTSSIKSTIAIGPTNQCFAYQVRKDSAFLNLEIAGQRVSGKLSYAIFEKDRNEGKLSGTMSGDTIFAHYTFASEGTQSVREVVFLKTGQNWVEGFGDVKDSAGVMIFSDRSKLDFKKGLSFKPVECPSAE
ncbi:hypothetical protein SAMN04487996_108139 [Dyadobacter soli]|uniref:Lipoprotein n=1 Tax=Dyadobacter soli TaxID=659014 RepID=A0A1G7HEW8_9BACT|nr:hypothetical protein [Dyadobacter soli]SDE99037.1 hypothetical protein SAMN04487996_108139 [Dyadobacter soli]